MESLLSIDWDYVTGDCDGSEDDNDPRCCTSCAFWQMCYVNAKRGSTEPLSRDEMRSRLDFLLSLRVRRGGLLYVAESHGSIYYAMRALHPLKFEVSDFDSHFDVGWLSRAVDCGNWITAAERAGHKVRVVQQSRIISSGVIFPVVFLCLSSPWTPERFDIDFYNLVLHFANKMRTRPRFIGADKKKLIKAYKGMLLGAAA